MQSCTRAVYLGPLSTKENLHLLLFNVVSKFLTDGKRTIPLGADGRSWPISTSAEFICSKYQQMKAAESYFAGCFNVTGLTVCFQQKQKVQMGVLTYFYTWHVCYTVTYRLKGAT